MRFFCPSVMSQDETFETTRMIGCITIFFFFSFFFFFYEHSDHMYINTCLLPSSNILFISVLFTESSHVSDFLNKSIASEIYFELQYISNTTQFNFSEKISRLCEGSGAKYNDLNYNSILVVTDMM